MTAEYSHEPLPTNGHFIRLLTVLPGHNIQPLAVTLQNVRLTEAVATYDAVSYMWGPDDESKAVWVGTKCIAVRKNIWRFLIHHRKHFLEEPNTALWIDSICINQQDLPEKGMQVAGMGQVFSGARQVLVWLDEVSEKTCLFSRDLKFTRRIYQQAITRNAPPTPQNEYEIADDASSWIFHKGTSFDPADRESVDRLRKSILAIANHPYWLRLWVVQETSLASGGPKVIQGSLLLSGDVLGVLKHAVPLATEDKLYDLQQRASFQNLCPSTRPDTVVFEKCSLSSLVHFYCFQLCGDLKDRIYGLIGLVDPASPAANIKVDYELEIWQLFLQVLDLLVKEHEIPKYDDDTSALMWVQNTAYALEVESADIRAMYDELPCTSPSMKIAWQPMSSPFQRCLHNTTEVSVKQLLQLFRSCRLSVSVAPPYRRLHRDPRRFFDKSVSRNLVIGESQSETQPSIGWRLRLWLEERLQSIYAAGGPLWMCKVGLQFPLAIQPLPEGKLQVAGYVFCAESASSNYKITLLPPELQCCLQDQFDERLGDIKQSWLRNEEARISLPVLELLQMSLLGRKSARGISYGSGLLI